MKCVFGDEIAFFPRRDRLNKGRCRGGDVCYIPPTFSRTGEPHMAHDSDYQHGSMDISAHKKSYQGFLTGSKWTFVLVMAIVIFMAIFRTHTG
jgi:hypothetical protein